MGHVRILYHDRHDVQRQQAAWIETCQPSQIYWHLTYFVDLVRGDHHCGGRCIERVWPSHLTWQMLVITNISTDRLSPDTAKYTLLFIKIKSWIFVSEITPKNISSHKQRCPFRIYFTQKNFIDTKHIFCFSSDRVCVRGAGGAGAGGHGDGEAGRVPHLCGLLSPPPPPPRPAPAQHS